MSSNEFMALTNFEEDTGKEIISQNWRIFASQKIFQDYMTLKKQNILIHLLRSPNSTVTDTAKALHLDKSNTAKEFKSLVSLNFIQETNRSGKKIFYSVFNNFNSIILEDGTFIPLYPLVSKELKRDRRRIEKILKRNDPTIINKEKDQ